MFRDMCYFFMLKERRDNIKIDTHVRFNSDYYSFLKEYCNKNGITLSKAIEIIIDEFKKERALEIKIESLTLEQEKIFKKINLTFRLLEQLYSDLGFEYITDVRQSDALKLFYRALRSGRLVD